MATVQSIPDIVAFSGQRNFTVISPPVTRTSLTNGIVNSLVSVGWEILSGPTAQSFGNGYVLVSQQSPWYDVENIPAWYNGNKIILDINNGESSAQTRIRVGVSRNNSIEHMSTTGFFVLNLSFIQDYAFCILSCPYQVLMDTENPGSITGTQDPNMAEGTFLVSAVNLPKVMLQRHRIIHCVFATNRLKGYNADLGAMATGLDYTCYATRSIAGSFTQIFLNQNGLRFLVQGGGRNINGVEGRRLWNRSLDLPMTDPTKWSGFFSPPYMAWKLPQSSDISINGFMWDSFVYTEGFTVNSRILLRDRNWRTYAGIRNKNVYNAGSCLFTCIDPVNVIV